MSARATIVFDGSCPRCRVLARWGQRRWPADVAAVEADVWRRDSHRLSDAQLDASVWWVEGESVVGGAAALVLAVDALGGPWRVVARGLGQRGVLRVAERLYALVARHRCARGCRDRSRGAAPTMSPWST